MNPLSQHPPRTPRHSVVSNSSRLYATSIYEQNEPETESTEAEAESVDEENDERMKEAEHRIRREEVWREMIRTSDGRDKAFVCSLHVPFDIELMCILTETNSIFYQTLLTISYLINGQPISPQGHPSTMGARDGQTLELYCFRVLIHEVRDTCCLSNRH